jgi:hypothetical protein
VRRFDGPEAPSSTSLSHRKSGIAAGMVTPCTASAGCLRGRTREDYEVCAKFAAVASAGPCMAVDMADGNFDVSEVL